MSSKLKEMKKTKPAVNNSKVVAIVPVNSENSTIESTPLKTEIIHRDEKGRFLKGFSGNTHAWATRKMNTPLALLCREKVEKCADVLNSLITGPTIDPMIKLGFEYSFGKPLQGSEVRDGVQ